MMKLKIYRDASDDGGGAGAGAGVAGSGQGAAAGAGDGAAAGGGAGAAPEKKEMTQAELDALVSGSRKEGAEKLAKQFGFTTTDGKADMKAFNDFVTASKKRIEDDKTAEQKAADERQKDKEAREAAEARALTAETKASALEAGVDPKKIDRAMKLIPAYDGDTPADKVAAFLAEFPEYKGDGKPVPSGGFGGKTNNEHTTERQKAESELDTVFGKKP